MLPTLHDNPEESLVVLGIDPGTQATGYALVEQQGENLSLLSSRCHYNATSDGHPKKLLHVHNELKAIVAKWRPSEVALEDFVFGNKQAAVAIGEARAVAILAAAQSDLPVFLYKPAEVKLAVAGSGGASKQQVQQMVQLHLSVETLPPSADATDAISIALGHIFKRTAQKLIKARTKT